MEQRGGAGGPSAAANAAARSTPSAPPAPAPAPPDGRLGASLPWQGHESRPGFLHRTWFRGEATADALRLLLRRTILQLFVDQGREAHAGAEESEEGEGGGGGGEGGKGKRRGERAGGAVDRGAYCCAVADAADASG